MKHREEGGYWPGFVDALTNVVFVMIILVVMLMLTFMVTLLKAVNVERQRVVAETTATEATSLAALVSKQLSDAVSSAMPSSDNERKKSGGASPNVAAVYVSPANKIKSLTGEVSPDRALAFVAFPARESAMDDKSVTELKALLSDKLDRIKASGISMRSDAVPPYVSEGRRLAYYRIVAIREWLVNQGVPTDKIDLRIADEPSVQGKQGVLLMSREQSATTND